MPPKKAASDRILKGLVISVVLCLVASCERFREPKRINPEDYGMHFDMDFHVEVHDQQLKITPIVAYFSVGPKELDLATDLVPMKDGIGYVATKQYGRIEIHGEDRRQYSIWLTASQRTQLQKLYETTKQ